MGLLKTFVQYISPEVRGADRYDTRLWGSVHSQGRDEETLGACPMIVHQVSTNGCLIETDATLPPGARIKLNFGDVLLHPAVVKRGFKNLYGCTFNVRLVRQQVLRLSTAARENVANRSSVTPNNEHDVMAVRSATSPVPSRVPAGPAPASSD